MRDCTDEKKQQFGTPHVASALNIAISCSPGPSYKSSKTAVPGQMRSSTRFQVGFELNAIRILIIVIIYRDGTRGRKERRKAKRGEEEYGRNGERRVYRSPTTVKQSRYSKTNIEPFSMPRYRQRVEAIHRTRGNGGTSADKRGICVDDQSRA